MSDQPSTSVEKDPSALSEYQQKHKPAREFVSRAMYLNHELEIMSPRRWQLNLPGRDFRFEVEDLVPALAGTIGKVVMVTAIVAAYAAGYGLGPEFISNNVRFEMLIAALLFVIPIAGFFNPRVNLSGTHGPMIPLIGLIVLAGGHPLALGILVGVFGLMLGFMKGGSRLVNITGVGVRGGLLIFIGITGLINQTGRLRTWSVNFGNELVFLVVIILILVTYAYLSRVDKRWMAIPIASIVAATAAFIMGAPFEFITKPGIPNINPLYWWGNDTGWMLGLPDLHAFVTVLPFAVLAIAMWPPDFLGHRIFQETHYPQNATKVRMDVDDTMVVASFRQIVGSILGGGNLTSSWGTYLIPASIAKRPIPAGAILAGVGCVLVALAGYPMDLAMWPPVLVAALIVGVFLPLLEAGMRMIKDVKHAESGAICLFASVIVNPVFGWAAAMMIENSGLLGDTEHVRSLPKVDRLLIPLITFLICLAAMALAGMIPGLPKIL